MSRYKILPLPSWCRSNVWNRRDKCLEWYTRIEPIFNREGFYYDRFRNESWVEFDGQAWASPSSGDFLSDLRWNGGNNRIHPDVYDAIVVLIKARLASPQQRQLVSIEGMMRTMHRQRIYGLKALMRWKLFKKAKGL